jgi:hypothetical protein
VKAKNWSFVELDENEAMERIGEKEGLEEDKLTRRRQ